MEEIWNLYRCGVLKSPAPGKGGTWGAVVPVQLEQKVKLESLKLEKRGKCADTVGGKLLPIKGLSLVIGIISDTVFRKIVRERRIVTPENQTFIFI